MRPRYCVQSAGRYFTFKTSAKVHRISNDADAFYRELGGDLDSLLVGSDGILDAMKEQFALTHSRKPLWNTQKVEDAATMVALQSAGRIS